MDLISIRPGEIRGGGNIVSPSKVLSDFDVSDSVLTSVSDTVDGKTISVFNVGYRGGAYFTVTGTPFIVYSEELSSLSVSVVLKKRSDDSVITSSSVSCIVNEDTTLTETTDSNGSATFTIPYDGTVNRFNLHFKYDGTNSIGACSTHYIIQVGTITEVNLFSTKQLIADTDTCQLVAEVTGNIGDDTTPVPLQYCPISIYEEYTPELTVTTEPSIIGPWDSTIITATLKDSTDGSRVVGETVNIYGPEDMDMNYYTYLPERSETSSYNSGDHSSACGSNINLTLPAKFELSFDFKSTIDGCRFNLCKNGSVTTNPQYSIYVGVGNSKYEYGVRTTSTNSTATNVSLDTDYHTVKITRDGDTLTYYIDGTLVGTKTASWIDSYSYTFYWSYWKSGTMSVKNIMIKELI